MAGRHRSGLEHKHVQRQAAAEPGCAICGLRLGRHKYGTDQCPNTDWKPGNGQPQWLQSSYREPSAWSIES